MKHFYFIVVMLVSSVFMSCGDTDIIIPQKDVYSNDTIPSFVVDAVNNAKLICDSIGEIKEVNKGKDSFLFKDEKGNTIKVDVFGNAEVCTYSKDTINIDYTVKESMDTSNSVCNTIWTGEDIYHITREKNTTLQPDKWALSFLNLIKSIDADVKYGTNVKYEETIYEKERNDTIYDTSVYYELNLKNTACVLYECDMIKAKKRVYADKYRKIKVDQQGILYGGTVIVITIEDNTLNVEIQNTIELYGNHNSKKISTTTRSYPLDSDSTFSILEEAGKEVAREEAICTEVRKKHEAYNYRRLQDGRICIYNHDKKYYDDGHLGFKFPYVLNDTTKWLDVKFTKEYE